MLDSTIHLIGDNYHNLDALIDCKDTKNINMMYCHSKIPAHDLRTTQLSPPPSPGVRDSPVRDICHGAGSKANVFDIADTFRKAYPIRTDTLL